jgi:thiamine transport system permease protein
VAGLVLMLCITSFTIVLTLGGGPGATTLEVAIYQTLRFDFDPARAVVLTAMQLALTLVLVAILARFGGNPDATGELAVSSRRHSLPSRTESLSNAAVIALSAFFVVGPLAAVVVSGLGADLGRLAGEASVRRAVATSLALAFAAAFLALGLSLSRATARRAIDNPSRGARPGLLERACDQGAAMILAFPPIVIGAGWFVLLRHAGDVFSFAPVMVVAVNAAMAMPFVMRAIRPAHDRSAVRHDRLAQSLGIRGLSRWRLIDWPVLRGPLLTGFAFAAALSLGDLGVIALFGSQEVQTLPYLLLLRLGSYRTEDAAGLALILALMTLALIWLAARTGEVR